MESAEKLNVAILELSLRVKELVDSFHKEVYAHAPIIVHQRLCNELVEVCRNNLDKKTPMDIPECVEILNAIAVMRKFYPELESR